MDILFKKVSLLACLQDLSKIGPVSDANRMNNIPSSGGLKAPLLPAETGPGNIT